MAMATLDLCTHVQLEISKLFPLLVPTSVDYSSYQGFLEVEVRLLNTTLLVL